MSLKFGLKCVVPHRRWSSPALKWVPMQSCTPFNPLSLPYLSSSRIQMAALGHALTPFCFVICQYLGLLPSQVHVLEVSLDGVHLFFLGRPGFLLWSLSSHCVAWRATLELSILKTCPSHLSLLSLIMSSNFCKPVFFLMSSFLTLSLHVIPSSFLWDLWWWFLMQ